MQRRSDENGILWLVRHGESTWNALGLIQGHADGPVLTENGLVQSGLAADHFRGVQVEAIYASDLERALQTASVIASALGLPVRTDAALRERSFGAYEGLPLSTLGTRASGVDRHEVVDASARPEGGESLDELYQRAGGFLQRVLQPRLEGDVVVVTHGGTIRALRAYCDGVSMAGTSWDDVPNGSIWPVRQPTGVETSRW